MPVRVGTPGRLRAALVGLLVLTAVAWAAAFGSVVGARQVVATARTDTVPALIGARQARAALVDADRVLARSFLSGDVALGGPGERYQDDIKAASQAVQQLAAGRSGTVDAAGVQSLQAVDSQVVTYTGLVEQADAGNRALPSSALGEAYLLSASQLLHDRDPSSPSSSGMLARLDALAGGQAAALEAGQRTWWLGRPALLVSLAGGVLLLAGLVGVQLWAARRFRRVLNPALVAATLAALALLVWPAAGLLQLGHGFARARTGEMAQLQAVWAARARAADLDGQAALAAQIGVRCTGSPCEAGAVALARTAEGNAGRGAEGRTVAAVRQLQAGQVSAAAAAVIADEHRFNDADTQAATKTSDLAGALDLRLREAEELPGLEPGISLLAVLTGGLVAVGLRPRLAEYAQ